MQRSIFTVTKIVSYIKSILEDDYALGNVQVEGEISDFKEYASGHMYFTLKDKHAAIRCVFFKSYAIRCEFPPKNGMLSIVSGRISIYEKTGDCQLYVTHIRQAGIGVLYENFEKLKKKLLDEGLFDAQIKKPIPEFVRVLGVVTSRNGAALQDIISTVTRRNPAIKIIFAHTGVQGDVRAEIIAALDNINQYGIADCVILARGGGSYEDLSVFNDELIARKIRNMKIPVITGIGHETDFTIADFAADFRAPTPTAAAEITSFDLSETIKRKDALVYKAYTLLCDEFSRCRARLTAQKNRRILKHPMEFIYNKQLYINTMQKRAELKVMEVYKTNSLKLEFIIAAANNLSPGKTLSRGFALVKSDRFVTDIKKLPKDVRIIMHGGTAAANITEVSYGTEENF